MGFLDDFGKKISSASQEAIAKGKDLADIAKLNSNIADEKNKINAAYKEIGKKYFETHAEDFEEGYGELVGNIKASLEKIATFEQQIVDIKGITKCPSCGAEVPKGAAFCTSCGTAIPQPEVQTAPVQEEATKTCPTCGTVLKAGDMFCINCGTKLEEVQQ
jgi:uncharacterized membrane protein YvbJ